MFLLCRVGRTCSSTSPRLPAWYTPGVKGTPPSRWGSASTQPHEVRKPRISTGREPLIFHVTRPDHSVYRSILPVETAAESHSNAPARLAQLDKHAADRQNDKSSPGLL